MELIVHQQMNRDVHFYTSRQFMVNDRNSNSLGNEILEFTISKVSRVLWITQWKMERMLTSETKTCKHLYIMLQNMVRIDNQNPSILILPPLLYLWLFSGSFFSQVKFRLPICWSRTGRKLVQQTNSEGQACIGRLSLVTIKFFSTWLRSTKKESAFQQFCSRYSGKEAVAELLIENGANIQFKDTDGVTPLHMSAAHGNFVNERLSLHWHKDLIFKRIIYRFAYPGNENITELLIKNGADINQIDKYGKSALDMAATFGNGQFRSTIQRKKFWNIVWTVILRSPEYHWFADQK